MNKNIIKRNIAIVTIASILCTATFEYDHKYTPQYEILDDSLAFAKYKDGYIYIGTQDYIDTLDSISDNDIIIADLRDQTKSEMKIYSSYKINNKDVRNDVLCALEEYEKLNPSEWSRSIESMRLEWFVHNMLYHLNYQTNRTADVDFEDKEEKIYNNKVINKILKL